MNIETLIQQNTAALIGLTAALQQVYLAVQPPIPDEALARAVDEPPPFSHAGETPSREQIRDRLIAIAGAQGREAVLALLEPFGVASLPDLPDHHLAALAATLP